MRNAKLCVAFIAPLALSALATAPAHAVTRTWVSGVGDDVNPCSRTAPCKTFAGAISKTLAGGEIDALDAAGFGAVTITKSITIPQPEFLSVAHSHSLNKSFPVSKPIAWRNARARSHHQRSR